VSPPLGIKVMRTRHPRDANPFSYSQAMGTVNSYLGLKIRVHMTGHPHSCVAFLLPNVNCRKAISYDL